MVAIVTVQVSQTIAPLLSQLQRTGAILSQGATNTAPGTLSLLTVPGDLIPLIKGSAAILLMTLTSGTVAVTTVAPHGFTTGEIQTVTIAGVLPLGYNGTYNVTVTGSNGFSFALAGSPGAVTTQGVYSLEDIGELAAQVATFFGMGASNAVYVLELGITTNPALSAPAEGSAFLATWIAGHPNTIYSYLVPRYWDGDAAFLAFLAGFQATTAKTYFWVTTTVANYHFYTALMKCVNTLIEAPGIPITEFTQAAPFWNSLRYDPSNTNRVAPFAFTYVFGVTPYPVINNGPLLTLLKIAGVNVILTGAEGGISNTIQVWGTMMDGRDFTYWYSVDWMQIQAALAVANEIINGSNNPINPLYYNQIGINRLETRLAVVGRSAVTFGLALGTVRQVELDTNALTAALDAGTFAGLLMINAVPFVPYNVANPSHYRQGIYNGLSITYTPARGFIAIQINIVVTDFVAQ